MDADIFMFVALELFAVAAVGLVAWTLYRLGRPDEQGDAPLDGTA